MFDLIFVSLGLPNDSGSLASFKEKKETKKTKERKPLSALVSERAINRKWNIN